MRRGLTPTQTVGPFFLEGLLREDMRYNVVAGPGMDGEPIRIDGHVYDGDRAPVPDALVEIWQADSRGRYWSPAADRGEPPAPPANSFVGFGRSSTDDSGRFWFETIKPGRVPLDGEHVQILQAPHVGVIIHARGLLNHLLTRIYFAGDPANETDPVLARVQPSRRETLLARPLPGDRPGLSSFYSFDIILQGAGETAFFNL
jgi:protocatechuate 3,4-dioxygenase alpha subunit